VRFLTPVPWATIQPCAPVGCPRNAWKRWPGLSATHNYQREHFLNLWFTLTVPDADEGLRIIRRLERETGIKIENMPAKKVFKIKVSFEMGGTDVL